MSSRTGDSQSPVALVHEGWAHLRLQRPLAAWACWQQALRVKPDDHAATEALAILDSATDLPPIARVGHRFRSPADPLRRDRWSSAFEQGDLRNLVAAEEVFAAIVEADPEDSAAFHNLGLCAAWRGENSAAINAFQTAVEVGPTANPDDAVFSWMLAEILRQGAGAELLSDDFSSFLVLDWPSPLGDPFELISRFAVLREIASPVETLSTEAAASSMRIAEWLDRPLSAPGGPASWVVATLIGSPGSLRLTSPDRRTLEFAESTLALRLGEAFRPVDRGSTPLPIRLMDADAWLMRLAAPTDEMHLGTVAAARRAAVEETYERRWTARPRIGLSLEGRPRSPAEAARDAARGDAVARVKIAALVNLREQLANRPRMAGIVDGYPFDRLRRRLGLPLRDESSIEEADVSSMSDEELRALNLAGLSDAELAEVLDAAVPVCDDATVAKIAAAVATRGLKGPESSEG